MKREAVVNMLKMFFDNMQMTEEEIGPRDVLDAFCVAMKDARSFSVDEAGQAYFWFLHGWNARDPERNRGEP